MSIEDEIQLGDDLRHLVTNYSFETDLDALLQRGRQARRRRLARRVAGIAVLAVAVASAVIRLTPQQCSP